MFVPTFPLCPSSLPLFFLLSIIPFFLLLVLLPSFLSSFDPFILFFSLLDSFLALFPDSTMDVSMHDGMATPPHTSPKLGFRVPLPKDQPPSDDKGGEEKKPEIEVVTTAALDLDSFLANYQGQTRIARLEFIGDYCPPLRIEAYKCCLRELQNTLNTEKYLLMAKKLNEALTAAGAPSIQPDTEWVGKTNRSAVQRQEKLDSELKSYKHNLIKESVRVGRLSLLPLTSFFLF